MSAETMKPKRLRCWAMIVASALFILLAVVVFSRQSFSARAAKLRPGMTRVEVFAVMGEPDHLIKLGDTEMALFSPIPFALHALFAEPGQTLAGNPGILATDFPAYVEFQADIAERVRVDGREVEATPHLLP